MTPNKSFSLQCPFQFWERDFWHPSRQLAKGLEEDSQRPHVFAVGHEGWELFSEWRKPKSTDEVKIPHIVCSVQLWPV